MVQVEKIPMKMKNMDIEFFIHFESINVTLEEENIRFVHKIFLTL